MKQLKMVRYSSEVTEEELPQGYYFAFFDGSDSDVFAWCDVCRRAGMVTSTDDADVFRRVMLSVEGIEPQKDIFFVVSPSGERVATSALIRRESDNSGYLHMVAAVSEVRGRGIGHAMLSFVLKQAEERKLDFCRLTTDDYRLAALKVYFAGGFKPVLYGAPEDNMRERWRTVCQNLGIDFDALEFIVR